MANDGLDGGAAAYLSFNLWGHLSLLLGCIDFERVTWRRVAAAISGVGVEPFDRIADEFLECRDNTSQPVAVIAIA
jgi:hypothetical protein